MRKIRCIILTAFIISASASLFPQHPGFDPEAAKMEDTFKGQSADMPKEVAALMPRVLKIHDRSWVVEQTMKILLQASLQSDDFIQTAENRSLHVLYKIIVNVYNIDSPMGKSTADSTLRDMRMNALDDWAARHPAEVNDYSTRSAPEKIKVNKGYIYIQKIFSARHNDGEGMVPESTSYSGFLHLEVDNGLLTAEADDVADRTFLLDKLLRQTAAAGVKIRWEKYFK